MTVTDAELTAAMTALARLEGDYYAGRRDNGWAPCVHGEGVSRTLERFKLFGPALREHARRPGLIPTLLRELDLLGADVTIAVDQWWGVNASGKLAQPDDGELRFVNDESRRFQTSIQADELDMALGEAYRRWAARHRVIWGATYVPSWTSE